MNVPGRTRQSLRVLLRSPGFSLLIVATLAIGLGANVAIFGVVRSVLMAGLPFGEPDRIVQILGTNPVAGYPEFGVSLHDFDDWRSESTAFSAMAAYSTGQANVQVGEQAERIGYLMASPSLFDVLGVSPVLGRAPTAEENEPGRDGVVVVSHRFWQDVMGGTADAVGSTIRADGREMTVIGVMPAGFFFPSTATAFWKPFGLRPDDAGTRGSRWVAAVGRLADGETVASADASLDAISGRLAATYPRSNEGWSALVSRLSDGYVSDTRPALVAMWAAVGVLLLIACANVANLLLARATRRQNDLAVRAALGAGRWTLVGEALIDSLLLSTAGGLAGLGLGHVALRLIAGTTAADLVPGGMAFTFDARVIGYTAALTLITTLIFGILPALRGTDAALRGMRRAGTRSTPDRRGWLRGGLVAAETALALVLVVGATLVVRSFGSLLSVEPGFEPEGRLAFRVAPSMTAYPERDAAGTLFATLSERLSALPGVVATGAANDLPLSGNRWATDLLIDGVEAPTSAERARGNVRVVFGDYFQTIGIPQLRGRGFQASDNANGAPVAVINQAAAARYFADRDPIGRTISFSPDPRAFVYTIVGVVGDERSNALDTEPGPMVYTPFAQSQFGHFMDWGMSFVVHVRGDPAALAGAVREAVRSVDPALPPYAIEPLTRRVADDVAQRKFVMMLLSAFGAIALILAAVGVYGVLSFNVEQRTSEIGIRMTLGAGRASVMRQVLARGLGWAGAGLVAGVALSFASNRLLETQLYGLAETDPASFALALGVLGGAAVLACVIPALRATRVDPSIAIRQG